ncbi:MAG TPA: hypothetical protein VMV60_04975 [Thermoanaerobaculia bacterium]|nr:hypothetical protein [Thermoanaerobaculia bacterium]
MKLWRALALTVLLAAGAALVWFAGSTAWSAGRERQALGAWSALGLPLPGSADSLPKKDTNAAARALEKVALPLGIDLRNRAEAQKTEPETPPSEKELAKTEWGRTRGPLTKWATDQAERPEANVSAPPVEVAAWMTGHAAELDTIENGLVAGPAPEWAEDQSLLFAAPSPNMAGHMQLHVVLLGRALARAAGGDTAGAEHALLASWNLAAPERQRVDVPSRSIASIATHLEMGVLRKLPVNAEPWRARLAAWDAREAVKRSWANEAWTTWRAARTRQEAGLVAGAPQGTLARLAGGPGRRLEAAAFLDAWRAMTESAVRSPVSDGDGANLAEAFRQGLGRWASAAPPIPNIGAAWKRADRLILEAELTNKVFDIRAKRDPSGAWPVSIPGIESSKAENVKWTYTITAEGRASVATNRVLNWPDRASSLLGWVSEPPAAGKAAAPKRR